MAVRNFIALRWAVLLVAVRTAVAQTCSSEQQLIQCGQLPVSTQLEQQTYLACCALFKPAPVPPQVAEEVAAAAAAAVAQAEEIPRPDLNLTSGPLRRTPNYYYNPICPVLAGSGHSYLRSAAALSPEADHRPRPGHRRNCCCEGRQPSHASRGASAAIRTGHNSLRRVDPVSKFVHPGGDLGPGELAAMRQRLLTSSPLQTTALNKFILGDGVPKRVGSP